MMRTNITFALACLVLAAATLCAQAPDANAVQALAALTGADYVHTRDALLSSGSLSMEALAAIATDARWLGDSWREAAVAAALRVRLLHPELADQIDHLRGVDPAHYSLRRVPAPEVGRELAHHGTTSERADVVTLIIETYVYLRDSYAYSEAGRDAEHTALSEGLLVGLERLADPRGLPLAREVVTDSRASIPDRVAAMIATGAMAGRQLASSDEFDESAAIALLVERAKGTARLRHAAAQALARIPSAASLAALRELLATETNPEVRSTILTSIGLFAAPMVWHSYGAARSADADALRSEAASLLASHFVTTESQAERLAARNATLMARHPAALEELDPTVPEQALLIEALNSSLERSH